MSGSYFRDELRCQPAGALYIIKAYKFLAQYLRLCSNCAVYLLKMAENDRKTRLPEGSHQLALKSYFPEETGEEEGARPG